MTTKSLLTVQRMLVTLAKLANQEHRDVLNYLVKDILAEEIAYNEEQNQGDKRDSV